MTIDEFSKNCGVKITTVKKNMERIPGVEYINREYRIMEGTRYFYTNRSKSLENSDRLYMILKALNKNLYIDSEILKCSEKYFNDLLEQLVEAKLIEKNNSQNKYGSNGFNITISGIVYAEMEKTKALKSLAEIFGTFVGAVVAQLN